MGDQRLLKSGTWAPRPWRDPENPDTTINQPKKRKNVLTQYLYGHRTKSRVQENIDAFASQFDDAIKQTARVRKRRYEDAQANWRLASQARFGKSMSLGGTPMTIDEYFKDPETLAPHELVSMAKAIKTYEAPDHAAHLAMQKYGMRVLKALRHCIQKGTTPNGAQEAGPPTKSTERQANSKGKVAYGYNKKNGGKALDKTPGKAGAGPEGEEPEAPPEPMQVDTKAIAAAMNVDADQLTKLAKQKSRDSFIKWFSGQPKLLQQLKLDTQKVGLAYDQLLSPPPPPQPPGAAGQMPPGMPPDGAGAGADGAQPMGQTPMPAQMPVAGGAPAAAQAASLMNTQKSFSFIAKARDPSERALIKACRLQDVSDIKGLCATIAWHFGLPDDELAARKTRALLNRWESQGVVVFDT